MMRLSLGRVTFLDDSTFTADSSGTEAILVPVHDRLGAWVDTLAYHLSNPARWALQFDDATPILGAAELAHAAFHHDPIVLQPTPEAWLRAGGRGVVILNWGCALRDLFDGVGEVRCAHPLLKKLLRRNFGIGQPNIKALPRRMSHAA